MRSVMGIWKQDFFIYLFFLLISLTVLAVAWQYPEGDKEFPLLVAGCLGVSSAFLAVRAFFKEGPAFQFSLVRYRKIIIQVILILGFFAALPRAGFFLAASLLSLLTIFNGGYAHKLIAVLFSLVFPGVIFFLFHVLLEVPLPASFESLGTGL